MSGPEFFGDDEVTRALEDSLHESRARTTGNVLGPLVTTRAQEEEELIRRHEDLTDVEGPEH